MIRSLILAIDQGGQSSRVAVYNNRGERLCCVSAICATQHFRVEHYEQEFIEQKSEEILRGIRHCLEKIQADLGDLVSEIGAAGFAGQGSSLMCWDSRTGRALTPVLSWQDIRGEKILQSLSLTEVQVKAITGLRLSPHFGASKMRWCLDNIPAVEKALTDNRLSIGPIVSYIFWHLLQQKNVVDPGHAQRTLLWDLQKNDWNASLLQTFKVPINTLPDCLFHNGDFGDLILGACRVPFTASARDQGASLFAQGLPDKNTCYINLGTGAFIQRVSENLKAPEGLLVSPLWLSKIPEQKKLFCWEASVNGAASAIPFMQQQTGLAVTPHDIAQALRINTSDNLYFLNAIGGLSAPYWRTNVQSHFCENLAPLEKILAWLESFIFQIIVNMQRLNECEQPSGYLNKIVISGGLSNADGICQKIADLAQIPVYRRENTDASLQGIAYLAGGMPEAWQPPQPVDTFMPQQNVHLLLRFETWQTKMHEWLQ